MYLPAKRRGMVSKPLRLNKDTNKQTNKQTVHKTTKKSSQNNKQTNKPDDLLPLFSDPAVMRSPPPGTKNPTGRQIIREITLRQWKWQ